MLGDDDRSIGGALAGKVERDALRGLDRLEPDDPRRGQRDASLSQARPASRFWRSCCCSARRSRAFSTTSADARSANSGLATFAAEKARVSEALLSAFAPRAR